MCAIHVSVHVAPVRGALSHGYHGIAPIKVHYYYYYYYFRIRHHSLNEQLKAICQQVPGSAEDSRETKVPIYM